MRYRKLKAKYGAFDFLIEEDIPEVGAYMYIEKFGKGFRDELQDNVNMCIEQAFEDYGVPLDSWKEVDVEI